MIEKKLGKRCSPATEFKKGRNLGVLQHDIDDVITYYQEIRTIGGVAAVLGISCPTVLKYLRLASAFRFPRVYRRKSQPEGEKLCACGCGEMIPVHYNGTHLVKFKHGHNVKSDHSQACEECGKNFACIQSAHRRFCSRSCGAKHAWKTVPEKMIAAQKANRPRGTKHHAWKGGISPLRLSIYHSPEYKRWRQGVFERDDFTCQRCGQKRGDIEAHHKVSMARLRFNHSIKSLQQAKACRALWRKSNGETLCHTCHTRTRNYCGRNRIT